MAMTSVTRAPLGLCCGAQWLWRRDVIITLGERFAEGIMIVLAGFGPLSRRV
jgi:hypothetical protein